MWKTILLAVLKTFGPVAMEWGAKKLTPPPSSPTADSKVVPFPSPATKEPLDDARE